MGEPEFLISMMSGFLNGPIPRNTNYFSWSLWLSGNIRAQKKRRFFQKTVFLSFVLRVTDISCRTVPKKPNTCQTLSVLNWLLCKSCEENVERQRTQRIQLKTTNLWTCVSSLALAQDWSRNFSFVSETASATKLRNTNLCYKNSVFVSSPFVTPHESNLIRRPCRTHFMQADCFINHAPKCENMWVRIRCVSK